MRPFEIREIKTNNIWIVLTIFGNNGNYCFMANKDTDEIKIVDMDCIEKIYKFIKLL